MQSVIEFVDGEYFSNADSTFSASTVDGYRKIWRKYQRYFAGKTLELQTFECQATLRQICREHPHLRKATVCHIKNFFSGVWSHALRMGVVKVGNPWREVQIPSAQEPTETHAYSPEEIEAMLTKLTGDAHVVVLLAACTGLRKSEIRGLDWTDWNPKTSTLSVRRRMWRSDVGKTKSTASKAPVPIVPALALELEKRAPDVREGFMFKSSSGTSLDLDNLARRVIVPAGVSWHGWHAFRRGLATFLHGRGVDDKTIQAILRHENVAVTQKSYIRTIPESIRNAMAAVNFGSGK